MSSRNSTSVYTQKELEAETQKGICKPVFTVALFEMVKRWKQPECPLTEEWIHKIR